MEEEGEGGGSTRKSLPCVHNKKSWWLDDDSCGVRGVALQLRVT